jgi:hypothetical protein
MEHSESRDKLFNQFQQNRLSVTCNYIDQLLKDIEEVLNTTASKSPFPKYVPDISPVQRKEIEEYVARFRARLVRALESVQAPLPIGKISALHSLQTSLSCIDIAVEELKPRYMRGYGELPVQAQEALNGIVTELSEVVRQFNSYLTSISHQTVSEGPDSSTAKERK